MMSTFNSIDNREMVQSTNNEPDANQDATAEEGNECGLSPIEILNDDCLSQVFENLELIDLIRMTFVCQRFRGAIVYRGTRIHKLFDIATLERFFKPEYIFETFGSRMAKLKVGVCDISPSKPEYSRLETLLDLLKTYCSEGCLIELHIIFDNVFTMRTEQFILEASNILRSVRTLSVICSDRGASNQFIKLFPTENLCRLNTLNDLSEEIWFKLSLERSLHHLYVQQCTRSDDANYVPVTSFLTSLPNLKSFRYGNFAMKERLCQTLAEHAQHVENFGIVFLASRRLLRNFTKLKSLLIWSFDGDGNDIFEILNFVEHKDRIVEVEIFMLRKRSSDIPYTYLKSIMLQFTSLTDLYLTFTTDPYLDNFITMEMVLPYFTHVTTVVTTWLTGSSYDDNVVVAILTLLENIRVLVFIARNDITRDFYNIVVNAWREKQQSHSLDYPLELRYRYGRNQVSENQVDEIVNLKAALDSDYKYYPWI